MKNTIKLLTTAGIIAVVLFSLAGCEDFLDINEDPNNPTEAPAAGLMTSATFETAQNMYRMGSITSYYVQYLGSPNPGSSNDTHERVSYGDEWYELYDVLTDLSDLELLAEEDEATEYLGIAKILKALTLATLVDNWGDVPYSEAFFIETLNPSYDSQDTLYTEVFTLLEEGIAELQKTNSTITTGNEDFIYGGDMEKWEQLANFLRARYLNHYSKQSSYDPEAVLAALDNAFTGNEDDAQVSYFEEEQNPWAQVAIDNAGLILGGWLSEQVVTHMNGETHGVFDPRIESFTDPTDAGIYRGVRNGAGRGGEPPAGAFSVLTTNTFYAEETAPVLIATYAEQKFIEAEAAFRNGQPSRAYQAYLDGIEAHMDKMGVPADEKNTYITDSAVAVGESGLTLDLIFKEKYTAMFLHPEAWVDARRFDYQYEGMELPANHNPALNGEFIRRLSYPDSETQRNSQNVPDVALSDRIWWDQ